MLNTIAPISTRATSRITGVLYLTIIFAGIFAEFFVRGSLIVPGDAAATAANVTASNALFRYGITADLIMIMSDVAVALLFYVLLKPVSHTLALLAAFFRLAQAATLGINLLNLFFGMQLIGGAGYLAVVDGAQRQALALMFMEAHDTGYRIALVFFALNCFILGYLMLKSGVFPKILGGLMVFAGLGYLTDSVAAFILPNYADFELMFGLIVFVPAVIGELSLALWLLVRGVTVRSAPQSDTVRTVPSGGMPA